MQIVVHGGWCMVAWSAYRSLLLDIVGLIEFFCIYLTVFRLPFQLHVCIQLDVDTRVCPPRSVARLTCVLAKSAQGGRLTAAPTIAREVYVSTTFSARDDVRKTIRAISVVREIVQPLLGSLRFCGCHRRVSVLVLASGNIGK